MAVPEKIDEFINRALLNLLKLSNSRVEQALLLKNRDLSARIILLNPCECIFKADTISTKQGKP